MKLLFLTPQLPYPPAKGTTLRNFYLIRETARRHEVHLLSLMDEPPAPEHLAELHRHCRTVVTVPAPVRSTPDRLRGLLASPLPDLALRLHTPAFFAALREQLAGARFDVVQVEGIELASAIEVVQSAGGPAVLLDEHNAEYLLQRRAFETDLRRPARGPAALYSLAQWLRLAAFERQALRRASAVVAVSEADAAALRRLAPEIAVTVVTNGIDPEVYTPVPADAKDAQPTLVFTGTMDFRPNVDAMLWFCQAILPRIRQAVPSLRLLIVGRSAGPAVQRLAGPAIEVTGRVDDVRPYLRRSAVYVVPLRMGGGTRFKVLEAMASGLPVVSTPVGAEGIDVAHGRELLLAARPPEFADAVVDLLRNPGAAHPLVQRARALVEQRYDWRVVAPRLEAAYEWAVGSGQWAVGSGQ